MTDQVRVIVVGAGAGDLILPDWIQVVEQLDWIPVDGQLPELNVDVIAHNDITGAMRITQLTDNDCGRLRWESWFTNKPTHWMRAPVGMPARADPRQDEGSIIYQGQL